MNLTLKTPGTQPAQQPPTTVSRTRGVTGWTAESRRKRWLPSSRRIVRFAHPAEAEFARILTFYRVSWLYEPEQFAIDWHPDGSVARMFAPDFYLPEFDLYVELTTQKQALVTRKNAKLRRLRELYPNLNIRLFYRKDLQRFLARFGIQVVAQTSTPPGGLVG